MPESCDGLSLTLDSHHREKKEKKMINKHLFKPRQQFKILVQSRSLATQLNPHPFTPNGPVNSSKEHKDGDIRNDWNRNDIQAIYQQPLLELVYRAASVHRMYHEPGKVQLCTLMNIKTGGCSEDCSYCSQSSRYSTGTEAGKLLALDPVIQEAKRAKNAGSTRFCMGAAWRDVGGRKRGFDRILAMVREIKGMGMEVCTTLGMLSSEQAIALKDAGLTAYNHNLDTSREYYPEVSGLRVYVALSNKIPGHHISFIR